MDPRPSLLVASPSLHCPFFGNTVVLLVDHDADGTFGFVLNKPSPLGASEILGELQLLPEGACSDLPVMIGGPVSPETGWVVFDPRDAPEIPGDTMHLTSELAVTASLSMLESIARGDAPRRALLALGYAGWAPGQLEREMREGSWIPVDADAEIVFDAPVEERWEVALRGLGIDPRRLVVAKMAQA